MKQLKINQTFGRWTVIARGNGYKWRARCVCGTEREVNVYSLLHGGSTSCGCLRKETISVVRKSHGMSQRSEYTIYQGIRKRCNNPSDKLFSYYGGRGIKCLFDTFEEFYAEVGDRPNKSYSIDRIDNDGHYEKGNLRWATRQQQAENRSNARLVTIDGVTRNVSQWCRIYGRTPDTVGTRYLKQGWCMECAITLPPYHLCPHTTHNAQVLSQKRTVLMPL